MKNILKLFLLCCSIFFSLFLLEKVYDFLLLQNKNIKASYILSEKINAEVLIHGPCEPLWMLNPTQLDTLIHQKTYNLSLSHSNFADNYLHLYLYLQNNQKPSHLLLYITPESMDERYNTFNTYRFAPFLKDTLIANVVKEFDSEYGRWMELPFMKHAYYSSLLNFKAVQGLKYYVTNREKPLHANGYIPPTVQDWQYVMDHFIELYPNNVEFQWSKQREKYFRKLIAFAKSKDIKVFLYEAPVYYEAIKVQPNRDEIMNRLHQLAKEVRVPFVAFENLEMAKDKTNFFSTLNMTVKGAEIFTDTLGRYLQKEVFSKK